MVGAQKSRERGHREAPGLCSIFYNPIRILKKLGATPRPRFGTGEVARLCSRRPPPGTQV